MVFLFLFCANLSDFESVFVANYGGLLLYNVHKYVCRSFLTNVQSCSSTHHAFTSSPLFQIVVCLFLILCTHILRGAVSPASAGSADTDAIMDLFQCTVKEAWFYNRYHTLMLSVIQSKKILSKNRQKKIYLINNKKLF